MAAICVSRENLCLSAYSLGLGERPAPNPHYSVLHYEYKEVIVFKNLTFLRNTDKTFTVGRKNHFGI